MEGPNNVSGLECSSAAWSWRTEVPGEESEAGQAYLVTVGFTYGLFRICPQEQRGSRSPEGTRTSSSGHSGLRHCNHSGVGAIMLTLRRIRIDPQGRGLRGGRHRRTARLGGPNFCVFYWVPIYGSFSREFGIRSEWQSQPDRLAHNMFSHGNRARCLCRSPLDDYYSLK
jgi:hypothetical protein